MCMWCVCVCVSVSARVCVCVFVCMPVPVPMLVGMFSVNACARVSVYPSTFRPNRAQESPKITPR